MGQPVVDLIGKIVPHVPCRLSIWYIVESLVLRVQHLLPMRLRVN